MRRQPLHFFPRLALCLAMLCATLAGAGADWPTYLHDAQRGAASSDETTISTVNAARLGKLWSFQTGGAIASSPSVAGGVVYVGSWDGYEYALDAASGALTWKTYLGQTTSAASNCVPASGIGVTSAATIQDGVVYLGGGGPYWYALDAANGRVLWRLYTGDNSQKGGHYNWASPLIYNGYAYIGTASLCDKPLVRGQLLKVDLRTHQVVATFDAVPDGQVGGGIWTSPSIDPATNTIYVTTGTNGHMPSSQPLTIAVVALDATTLAVKSSWQIPPARQTNDADWGDTPVLFDDASGAPLVAAINKNGYLYAFRRGGADLEPLWQRRVAAGGPCPTCGDGSASSGAFGAGRLYMAGGATVIATGAYSGSVRAFDPTTGAILWEHGASRAVIGALAYANGLVVDGAGNRLEVLNAASGTRLYNYQTGGTLYGAPSIAEGRIFAGSADGAIYAFGFATSGVYAGSLERAGSAGSYAFTPGTSGPATIGSCAASAGVADVVYVYGRGGALLGEGATPSSCNWAGVNVTAGQTYTVTTVASSGAGVYRSAWSVNGAPQTWSVGGALRAGGAQSFSFPTLSAGPITLSACATGGALDTSMVDGSGTAVLSGTTPTACGSLTYTYIANARGLFRLRQQAAGAAGAWSGTITVGRPSAGSYSGSISSGGNDSYSFVPGIDGAAIVGSCAVNTGDRYNLAVYDGSGHLLGSGASGSYCDWVNVTVSAGRRYTVTTSAVSGDGAYRSAWSVGGAQVVWRAYSALGAGGAGGSFSFPTLGAGPIALSTCGPSGADFNLALTAANGDTLARSASPASCEALTYTPRARGLFRLHEIAVSGAGAWYGAITTS